MVHRAEVGTAASLIGQQPIKARSLILSSSSNRARDQRRDIARAIRKAQQSKMAALEAYAQGLTDLRSLRMEVKELEARVEGPLRAAAKDAGNTAADIRAVERIVNELSGSGREADGAPSGQPPAEPVPDDPGAGRDTDGGERPWEGGM